MQKPNKRNQKNLNCYFDPTTTTRSGRFWHSSWGKTNRNCSGSLSWMMKLRMRNASKLMRVWQEWAGKGVGGRGKSLQCLHFNCKRSQLKPSKATASRRLRAKQIAHPFAKYAGQYKWNAIMQRAEAAVCLPLPLPHSLFVPSLLPLSLFRQALCSLIS